MMGNKEKAALLLRWKHDPIAFVRELFKAEPDEWQAEFLRAYITGKRTYAKACKGPGKTTVIAWCCWHFLVCFKQAKIPATSITAENLRNNLWAEMAKWQNRSDFLIERFKWTATRIYCIDSPETWFMVALSWSQDATGDQQANSLAGYHADNIMFVLDEMGGIPDAVSAAAEASLANAGTEVNPNAIAKIIGAGNPTHLTGPLYRACTTEASMSTVIEITGDPDSPRRSKRISIEWAREQIKKYGRDNPYVLVNVFGKFPPSSINALLGPDEVEAAMKRVLKPEVWRNEVKILGVDVALQGDDRTVIAPRQGPVCFKPKILRLDDPKLIAGVVAQAIQKFKPDAVFVDNTGGWGSGVISWLRDWQYTVTDIQFSGKALDRVYANKRSEMHHTLAYYVKGGGCLPDIPELKEELCAQTNTHHKDQLIMTDKKQIKADLGRSPDLADAYALTFAYPVVKRDPLAEMKNRTQAEYDPVQRHFGIQDDVNKQNVVDYTPLG